MLSTNNRLSLKSRLITLSFSGSVQYVGNNRTIGISGCCLPSCYVRSICPFMLFVPLTFPACLLLKLIKYPTVLFISLWAVHDDFCHCLLWLRREGETHSIPTLAYPPTLWAVRATCYSPTGVKTPTKSHKLCFKCSQSFYRGCFPVFPVEWQCSSPLSVSLADVVFTWPWSVRGTSAGYRILVSEFLQRPRD